jgi:hypothetical protein
MRMQSREITLSWMKINEPHFVASDFLEPNGRELHAADGVDHAEMMELLGQGKISREEASEYLRKHS